MSALEGIRGLLLDIDGTLLVDDRSIAGAAEILTRVRAAGLPVRLVTNTTRRSRAAIASALRSAGLEAAVPEILTPAILARRMILDSSRRRALLLVTPEARTDFDGVDEGGPPEWVVVGDLGRGFTWKVLNGAFRALREGASLVALHKNRFWFAGEDGWVLDAGAFVTALEYATGMEAIVVGKPAVPFFRLALQDLGLPAGEVLVVGDDLETDIAGGAAAGCRTALVRTGKGAGAPSPPGGPRPDRVLESIADLL